MVRSPIADYRKAFAKSIDMEGLYDQIYAPFAQGIATPDLWSDDARLYCDPEVFVDTYDPEGAAQILTDAGWTQNGDGIWAEPRRRSARGSLYGQHRQHPP